MIKFTFGEDNISPKKKKNSLISTQMDNLISLLNINISITIFVVEEREISHVVVSTNIGCTTHTQKKI